MSGISLPVPPPSHLGDDPQTYWRFKVQKQSQLFTQDTSAGNVTTTLPPAGVNGAGQTNQGQHLIYRKVSADANTFTITGSADGPQVLTTGSGAGSVVHFYSDAVNWWVI